MIGQPANVVTGSFIADHVQSTSDCSNATLLYITSGGGMLAAALVYMEV